MAVSQQTNGQKIVQTLWRERNLKRDFEIVLGKMLQSNQGREDETEESYLRSANVQWDGVDLSDVKTMWFSPAEKRDLLLREGDLVVNEGGDVGRCAIWRGSPESFYFQNAINRVRARTLASTRFLYYWLYNLKYAGFIDAMVSRITIAHLTAEKLARVPCPDVPAAEQHRIAAYLDASCAAIDGAIAAKRGQLETLDSLRNSIIQRAVTRGITESVVLESTGNRWMEQIPKDWKLVCLKRIAEIQGGLTLGKHYEGPLIERPYLRVGNVQDGHLDLADVSVIELPASVAAGVELRPDDVLMTEGGDLDKLGRGHLWHGEIPGCLHQNHIFAVRCFLHKLKPRFLAYVTAAKYGRDYFEATGKKTTNLANTNTTKVGRFPIPLPPLTEQATICAHLDEKTAELNRIVATIESQITTLTAYRKSLIHECVTGRQRITEADVQRAQSRSEQDD
ncbi:MAG: restriction endonuclease subunit S [Gammaproteobacteria bacterium]|nr:restriction endonuclease subunit S [Gammaproteobacteria bacterium]